MKRPFIFLFHFGYWLLYLTLLAVIFSIIQIQVRQTGGFSLVSFISPAGLACVVPNVLAFYTFYLVLFTACLRRKRIFALIVFGILTSVASAFAGYAFLVILFGASLPAFNDPGEFAGIIGWLFLVASIHGGIALVMRGFVEWYAGIRLKEELDRQNFEMNLAMIKSQINPHFLFNTINNIDVLIEQDPVRASDYLNKLSDIMRYMLYETKTERIALETELAYIEKYLELQKIRYVNRDHINYAVDGIAAGVTIAPMLFFPFIENAFKHAARKSEGTVIDIRVIIDKSKLTFECSNLYRRASERDLEFGGLGNDLAQRRLALLYPGRHSLAIDDSGDTYKVRITLDLYED